MEDEIRKKVREAFYRKLDELGVEKELLEMSYDELYNEIIMNSEDIDALMTIAESIRFNERLTDWQKEKLWELIDKMATKRG